MAASWIRINGSEYLNVSCIESIKYDKGVDTYVIQMRGNTKRLAETVEHATTFDITDEKEN